MAGVAVGSLLQFLIVLVLTRGLDAGSAGALLETIAFFTIVANSSALGTDAGIIREISGVVATGRSPNMRRLLTVAGSPVAVVGFLLALASFVAAHPIADVFFDASHRHDGATYIRIVAPALPLAALTIVGLAATRGFGTMVPWVAVQSVGIPALRLAFVSATVAAGLSRAVVTVAWTLPVAVGALATFVMVGRLVRKTEATTPSTGASNGTDAVNFWRFSAPRAIAGVLDFTVLTLDVLLVGALRSTREAAVYAASSRFVIVGTFLLAAVSRPLTAQFSRLLALGDIRAVGSLYHVSTWWMMMLAWPLYIMCAFFAGTVMAIFGAGYSSGATALVILSLASLLNLGTGNMSTLLLMAGKSSWELANSAVAVVLNVTLNIVLIPRIGIAGAATAWAASIAAFNLAAIIEIRLLLGLRPFSYVYAAIVGATCLCFGVPGVVARFAFGDSVQGLAAAATLGTLLYAVFLRRSKDTLRLSDLAAALRPRS